MRQERAEEDAEEEAAEKAAAAAGEQDERAISVAHSANLVVRGMVRGFLLQSRATADSTVPKGCVSPQHLGRRAGDVMEASVRTVDLLKQILRPAPGAEAGSSPGGVGLDNSSSVAGRGSPCPTAAVSFNASSSTAPPAASDAEDSGNATPVLNTSSPPVLATAPGSGDGPLQKQPLSLVGESILDDKKNPSSILHCIRDGLVRLIHLECELADQCTNGRSLDALRLADRHLRNFTYVGGRLVANGADMHDELEDALAAFQADDLPRFGESIGRAWRKVLLSKVPEVPRNASARKAIEETSEGLVEGFFGPELLLQVTDSEDSSGLSQERGGKTHVDIHQCVQDENMRFFAEVWDATWLFFTQLSAANVPDTGGSNEGLNHTTAARDVAANDRWQRELSVALADLPTALRRCGINKAQEEALMDSLHTLGQLKFHFNLPTKEVSSEEFSVDLVEALRDWEQKRWKSFGVCIGRLLQELVLLVFPQRYSLDGGGHLQQQLYAGGLPKSVASQPVDPRVSHMRPPAFTAVAGAAALLVLGMALVRGLPRHLRRTGYGIPRSPTGDHSSWMCDMSEEELE